MFKWLTRKREEQPPQVIDHGRYVYKPVAARALSRILDISEDDVLSLVDSQEVYFNEERLTSISVSKMRLHSGRYEIKIPERNRIYRFYIV